MKELQIREGQRHDEAEEGRLRKSPKGVKGSSLKRQGEAVWLKPADSAIRAKRLLFSLLETLL